MVEDRLPLPGGPGLLGQPGLPSQPVDLPGETEVRLAAYLTEHGFAEAVMERIRSLHLHPRKAVAWGLFCLANLILLAVLGANEPFLSGFFAPQAGLSQFFFLFLGITFLGGLVGLVLCVDTSRLLPSHHGDD
ncbi:MAG: hypothetical protein A2064_04035 [Spirochaetes bacterium GWB1_66_5]|nr:MAG: hypothetical protein A2064_04035 [Spirochaetes bacterium GWB1_66_5]